MITAMIRAKLLATAGVTNLVGTRIYIDALPSESTLPGIFISKPSWVPNKEVAKGVETRIQISCWSNPAVAGGSRSPAEVESVAAAVRAVMHMSRLNNTPYRLTIGSVSYDIISSVVQGGVRKIEDPSGWYHIPVDVLIHYREV